VNSASGSGLPAAGDRLLVLQYVRVLGAIGVIETERPLRIEAIQKHLVDRGVWLRPFGRLLYTMPPYIIDDSDLRDVTSAMVDAVTHLLD